MCFYLVNNRMQRNEWAIATRWAGKILAETETSFNGIFFNSYIMMILEQRGGPIDKFDFRKCCFCA